MKAISQSFENQSEHRLRLVVGSSGKLYAQIRNGAPFQIFLSADQTKPKALVDQGLAVAGSKFTYAKGSLVLWSSDPNKVDAEGEVLKRGQFSRLAIANPRLAPYGAAALMLLKQLGLEATKGRWVQGENINQTYQFVATGNADLGLIAMSQIMKAGKVEKGSYWVVPGEQFSAIGQDAVLLSSAEDCGACKEFLAYLAGAEVAEVLAGFGF